MEMDEEVGFWICWEGRANQPARLGKKVRKKEMSRMTLRFFIRANGKGMLQEEWVWGGGRSVWFWVCRFEISIGLPGGDAEEVIRLTSCV